MLAREFTRGSKTHFKLLSLSLSVKFTSPRPLLAAAALSHRTKVTFESSQWQKKAGVMKEGEEGGEGGEGGAQTDGLQNQRRGFAGTSNLPRRLLSVSQRLLAVSID